MTVPYAFASATTSIPLSELDANFNTPITLGNTAIQLGNTVTTLNNMTLANATVSSGNVTITSASLSGNLTFTGTGNRITGDFSNSTLANRVVFQTSTVNGATNIGFIPNGTSTTTRINLFNATSTTNYSVGSMLATSAEVRIVSDAAGSGTQLPLTIYVGGSEAARFVGGVGADLRFLGINNPTPTCQLDVVGGIQTSRTGVTAPATTDGNVFSGTYTPEQVSTNTNVAAVSFIACQYMRVGSVVTVSGQISITATTAATNTVVKMTVPVTTLFSASRQLAGTGVAITSPYAQNSLVFLADNANESVDIRLSPTVNTSLTYNFSFTYLVS